MVYPLGGAYESLAPHPLSRWIGIYRFPPLALLTVAAHFPPDWEVRVFDENVEPVPDEEIDRADYVLLSGLIMHYRGMVAMAERVAARGKHVVVGGPLANISRPLLQRCAAIKTICLGECEPYMAQLVRDMRSGTVRPVYGEESLYAEMTEAPAPRYDLLRHAQRYIIHSIQTSRGCPFACEYCDVQIHAGRRMRSKSPAQVLGEMEAIRRTAKTPCSLFIWDDNLTGNPAHARELLTAIAGWQRERGYPFLLGTQLSLDAADRPELLELLYAANVRAVYCGIESPSAASLTEANKRHNLKRGIVDRVADFQRAGIEVAAYLMLGFDGDPPDICEQQLDLVEEMRVNVILPSALIALDRTPLSARLEREGRLLGRVGEHPDEANQAWAWGDMNFVPRRAVREIKSDYLRLLEEPYRPRRWYRRTRRCVERLPERDAEHLLIAPRLSAATISLALTALFILPGRLRLLWEALVLLWRTRQPWRVWRYFDLVVTADLVCAHEYRLRVKELARRLEAPAAAEAREAPMRLGEEQPGAWRTAV